MTVTRTAVKADQITVDACTDWRIVQRARTPELPAQAATPVQHSPISILDDVLDTAYRFCAATVQCVGRGALRCSLDRDCQGHPASLSGCRDTAREGWGTSTQIPAATRVADGTARSCRPGGAGLRANRSSCRARNLAASAGLPNPRDSSDRTLSRRRQRTR